MSDAVGPAADLTVDAYEFFSLGGSGNIVSSTQLSQFGTVASGSGTAGYSSGPIVGGGQYSSLTVEGTSYITGVLYDGAKTSGTLATITLGANVPSNFILGFLGDNSSDPGNNTAYTVTAASDGANATVNSGFAYTGANGPVADGPPYTGYALQ